MDPGGHTKASASRSAAERLAELRARTLDLILLVMLAAIAVPMVLISPGAWRAHDIPFLVVGWAGPLVIGLLYVLRSLPFRVRAWAFLAQGLVMFVLALPHGIAPVPLANAALSAIFAALLLGSRAGVAWALVVMALVAAPSFLPESALDALRIGEPTPAGPTFIAAMGIFPFFGAIAGIAIVVRGLVRSFAESQSLVRTLESSENRIRGIFEASPEAIALLTWPEARFFEVNPGFTRLYGWASEEVLGRTPSELGMLREADRQLLHSRLEAEVGLDGFELPGWRRDGAAVSVQMTLRRTEIAGRRMTLMLSRDVTSQRRLEAAVRHTQRIEAMGTLAGGIAHNFRNALGSILPNLDYCLSAAPPQLQEPLQDARSAASAAVDLAARLTRMAHQEAGVRRGPVDLRSVLADVVGICRSTFGARIAIHERLDEEGLVFADRGDLHQVFLNLCLNARDAVADASEPRIEVGLSRSPDGSRFVVTVADNGHGMDPETLRRVGEPFFTTKPEGRGTGLGLSTAFASVRELGGRMTVASSPWAGTTFTLELPPHSGEAAPAEPAPPPALRGNIRALVVDDDPLLLEAVSRQLASLGLDAEPFTDPAAALARVRAAPRAFDVLITDLDMPGLTGRELAAQVRGVEPELPIVVLSGTPHSDPIPEAAAVLAKPASTADLAAAVVVCLNLDAAHAA